MKQFITKAIVLRRTDYGEADKIITFLTEDQGKISALAKSVRKPKSKLAGGIELFSVSELTLIKGRSKINTLISTRLLNYYGSIVKDGLKTHVAYNFINLINKSTEDFPEASYFRLLRTGFEALDCTDIEPGLVNLWFEMQLLRLSGHQPNLKTDIKGQNLKIAKSYSFNIERMRFGLKNSDEGDFTAKQIKFLRIGFAASRPETLARIEGTSKIVSSVQPLVQTMLRQFVRI